MFLRRLFAGWRVEVVPPPDEHVNTKIAIAWLISSVFIAGVASLICRYVLAACESQKDPQD